MFYYDTDLSRFTDGDFDHDDEDLEKIIEESQIHLDSLD